MTSLCYPITGDIICEEVFTYLRTRSHLCVVRVDSVIVHTEKVPLTTQSGREESKTIPATTDDGKSPRKRTGRVPVLMLCIYAFNVILFFGESIDKSIRLTCLSCKS